jgi:nicotinic acid mononucleotide adenylyltransferase
VEGLCEILQLCDFCVISRPGRAQRELPIAVGNAFCYEPSRGVYVHRSGRALRFLPVTALMISASDIRHAAPPGDPFAISFPRRRRVRRYHGLYTARTAAR